MGPIVGVRLLHANFRFFPSYRFCLYRPHGRRTDSDRRRAANAFDLTTYAKGLTAPTDIAVLADGRAVIIERTGAVKIRGTNQTRGACRHDSRLRP